MLAVVCVEVVEKVVLVGRRGKGLSRGLQKAGALWALRNSGRCEWLGLRVCRDLAVRAFLSWRLSVDYHQPFSILSIILQ
jgi:hypothetical protein